MCLVGMVVRRYIDFLILLIPTPLVSVLFLQQHPIDRDQSKRIQYAATETHAHA